MTRLVLVISTLSIAVAACAALAASPAKKPTQKWDTVAAAGYLDLAEERWATWPRAQQDKGTFCVSCHTASLYALARPALRKHVNDPQFSAGETKLFNNIITRINAWNEIAPYYPDQRFGLPKTSESRASEAVINALVLANRDSITGTLSDETRQAFKNMWALQMQRGDLAGGWAWMNFKLDPWEGERSGFYGASLAALAIGTAPQNYAKSPEIQENLKGMAGFILKRADGEILFNTATALWASSVMPDILTPAQKQAIVAQLLKTQTEDGGWSMNDMGSWKRVDDSVAEKGNDAYATGVAVLALKKSGDPAAAKSIQRGTAWLIANQDKSGMWTATSVNKKREIKEDNVPGYFMLDAASAMAVLALTN